MSFQSNNPVFKRSIYNIGTASGVIIGTVITRTLDGAGELELIKIMQTNDDTDDITVDVEIIIDGDLTTGSHFAMAGMTLGHGGENYLSFILDLAGGALTFSMGGTPIFVGNITPLKFASSCVINITCQTLKTNTAITLGEIYNLYSSGKVM